MKTAFKITDTGFLFERIPMKLATYDYRNTLSCGILTDGGFLDIPSHTQGPKMLASVMEILNKGDKALEILRDLLSTVMERIPPDQVKLQAPIPSPGKILALAGNYRKHLKETA
jgi:2-keto-4-pentenoate hydratase/2-oxohepta-3-ene-1,7-dioic acid hydratase in catechol pathway